MIRDQAHLVSPASSRAFWSVLISNLILHCSAGATTTSTPTSSPTYPSSNANINTWASIQITALVCLFFLIFFLSVFEIARRNPSTCAVYDRKREVRPNRTPPPLARGAERETCFSGYMFEWLFVEGYTDASYAAYAQEIADERERRPREQWRIDRKRHFRSRGSVIGGGSERRQRLTKEEREKAGEVFKTDVWKQAEDMDKAEKNRKFGQYLDSQKHKRRGSVGRAPEDKKVGTIKQSKVKNGDTTTTTASIVIKDHLPQAKGAKSLGGSGRSVRFDDEVIVQEVISGIPLPLTERQRYRSLTDDGEVWDTSLATELLCKEEMKRRGRSNTLDSRTTSADASASVAAETSASDDETVTLRRSCLDRYRRLKYFPIWPGVRFRCDLLLGKSDSDASWTRSSSTNSDDDDTHEPSFRIPPSLQPAPLSNADTELLHCVGLDSFVAIRFLRMAFDCTFYMFILSCLTLIPIYVTATYDGESAQSDGQGFGWTTDTTSGYFSITINHLHDGSNKLFAPFAFAVVFYLYVLRRLWVEWRVFMELREDFMANGDPDALEESGEESLKQFRNSCLIQDIPKTHRRDKDLNLFFDSLFPGQVVRAELVVQNTRLSKLVAERQTYIEKYEEQYARQYHRERVYEKKLQALSQGRGGCRCKKPQKPEPPQVRVEGRNCLRGKVIETKIMSIPLEGLFCTGRKVEALPYFLSKIEDLNGLIDREYLSIVARKKRTEESSYLLSERSYKHYHSAREGIEQYLKKIFTPKKTEHPAHRGCSNGFVEFASVSAKMSAVQCNLTFKKNKFTVTSAPDPRDIVWDNILVSRTDTNKRKFYVELILLFGVLFWAALVSMIGSISKFVDTSANLGSMWVVLVAEFLPVLITSGLLVSLPFVIRPIGLKAVRFKSRSENESWTIKWHIGYRMANFLAILLSSSIWETIFEMVQGAASVARDLVTGILQQSQFFFNIILVITGFNLAFQLAQPQFAAFWMVVDKFITEESMSDRRLERLKAPRLFDFGLYVVEFIYALMIALVYAPLVPLLTGLASFYFFIAIKVYIHQCLFVYVQPYEGGGAIFYIMSRSMLIVIYVAILVFGGVFVIKDMAAAATVFVVIMLAVTFVVDRRISENFVHPSRQLPLTSARIVDEESKDLVSSDGDDSSTNADDRVDHLSKGQRTSRVFCKQIVGMGIGQPRLLSLDGDSGSPSGNDQDGESDYYLYRQPDLNTHGWESKPRPYRDECGCSNEDGGNESKV